MRLRLASAEVVSVSVTNSSVTDSLHRRREQKKLKFPELNLFVRTTGTTRVSLWG